MGTTLYAQEARNGMRGGVQMAALASEDRAWNWGAGYYMHLLLRRPVAREWALQPELGVSLGGSRRLALTKLQLGAMLQWYPQPEWYFQAGHTGSYLLPREEDEAEEFALVSFQGEMAVGVGYQWNNFLGVEVRYGMGLHDLRKEDGPPVSERWLQIGLNLSL